MSKPTAVLAFATLLLCMGKLCLGLEYNKQQRVNPNTDFLLHEVGGNPASPKRDYVAPQISNNPTGNLQNNQQSSGKRDYDSQFPALGSSSTSAHTTIKPNLDLAGTTPQRQSTWGKRDYVAPQIPSQNPIQDSGKPKVQHIGTAPTPPPSSGKRDYVAPQNPSLKPVQDTGKVKDLVNFYDNKNNDQKIPSYSSILQGPGGNNKQGATATNLGPMGFTQYTQKPTTITTKPLSFTTTATTSKPTSSPGKHSPTSRPATPVLPSTIVNRNKNSNQESNKNGPTDSELQILSEELLRKDVNNAAKYITVNYQEKTTSQSKEDKAPLPLLTITVDAWNIPTVQKFVPLLDNYERDTLINEYVTAQERNEENAFMDAIMATTVIRQLMIFLKDKGYVTPDPRQQRDFLKQLWFSLYSRGKGKISSSGFEHIFVSELKNGEVSGLHNWIYFSREESANRANYLGYLKYSQFSDKGVVMKLHFNQQGVDKPVDTMFIGTSPELEIALYTLCFVTRADKDCNLKLGTKDVNIVTHTFRYRSKNLIGSAYPQI